MLTTDLAPSTPADTESHPPLFSNRVFWAQATARVISQIGTSCHSVAVGFWMLQQTGNVSWLSLMMALRFLPGLLLGPLAGTVVDRFNGRLVMIAMDTVRAVLAGVTVLLMSADRPSPLLLSLLVCLIASASAFYEPAQQASLRQYIRADDLQRATSLFGLALTGSGVVGLALGGAVVTGWGVSVALGADAISFVVSGFLTVLIGWSVLVSEKGAWSVRGAWSDLREANSLIRQVPYVRGVLLLYPLWGMFGAAHYTLMNAIAVQGWGLQGREYGLFESAYPLGAALAAASLALVPSIRNAGRGVGLAMATGGLINIIMPLTSGVPAVLPLILIDGFCSTYGHILMQNGIRLQIPVEMQGRAFGLFSSVANMTYPLGLLLSGPLADRLGVLPVTIAAGGGFLLTAIYASIILRRPAQLVQG